MLNPSPRQIKVGLDPALAPWIAEVKYVFRTLLRIAGYAYEFTWSGEESNGNTVEIYYGLNSASASAPIRIAACGRNLTEVSRLEPITTYEQDGTTFLDFTGEHNGTYHFSNGVLKFSNDIITTSYWLLTGAHESQYPRDRWDNLRLNGSFFLENLLVSKPLVSIYSFLLRKHLQQLGHEPLALPWTTSRANAAFALSHDVDYPQMIRWIECLRLFRKRGFKSLSSINGVLRGTNNFWKFSEWVEFEKGLGTRPSFYFIARQGSLFQYAMGTPDGFYNIRAPEFRQLFRYLKEENCEVGLHASYHAYRSVEQLRREKQVLEEAAGVQVDGNRHHFWHLDPKAPHETLLKNEEAGFRYDSSLALEFYPGFRRGICHPFRAFHPGERRELNIVELPPAWMDDHFDRRLQHNKIADPESYASNLVKVAQATNGVIVVDYHPRGMNSDFYPRYGSWLVEFVKKHLDSSVAFYAPQEIVRRYLAHETALETLSLDRTTMAASTEVTSCKRSDFEVGPMRADEAPIVARLHFEFFGAGEMHGNSIATLGCEFLEKIFYRLNTTNPTFFCDVARYRNEIIGFSVYSTRRDQVFRHMLRHHSFRVARAGLQVIRRNPLLLVSILKNLRYLRGEKRPEIPWLKSVSGWWLVACVRPEYRTMEAERQIGVRVAAQMFDRMERTMSQHDCHEWYGVVHPRNAPMNIFLQRRGARRMGTARAQGMEMSYYLKTLQPLLDNSSGRVASSSPQR